MQSTRKQRTLFARPAVVAGAAALVASGAFATVAAAGTPSTSSVIKSVKAAIKKQSGARVVSMASAKSTSTKETETVSFGTSTGEETITRGAATLTIRVTPTDAFVSGSSSGLTTIFGVSATDAKKIGADWVYWKSGSSQYKDLKKDVTVSALTSVLPKATGTKRSTGSSHGAKIYALKWTSAATSTEPKLSIILKVSARSDLPVTLTSGAAAGTKITTTFSHWGTPVSVSAPAAASTIPSSQITG